MADHKAVPSAPSPDSANTASKGGSGETPPSDRAGLVTKLKEKVAIPRPATPYFVAALLAAAAMGWYFFLFVPQKLEYFVGLRFRTLAVASGQIKGKAESLGLALYSAPAPPADVATTASDGAPQRVTDTGGPSAEASAAPAPAETDTAKYLRLLVPDIRLDGEVATQPSGLQLVVNRAIAPLRATVAWDRVASQAAIASAAEFDDLVIADSNGDVVWQREKTTPRLGNLSELLYAADDKGTLMSPSWAIRTVFPAVDSSKKGLPKTATLKAARIGSTSTLMLVQAVPLDSAYITNPTQRTLYVAGFVSRGRLQQEAMRIPLAWLVVVWLPVGVLFLALPFIKLATMQAKERFSFVNLILMAVGTIAAAGLAAVIPVGPRAVSDAGDAVLEDIATLVDKHLGEETSEVLALAKAVAGLGQADAKKLKPCLVPNRVPRWNSDQLCDLWEPLATVFGRGAPELDVAIWVDDRGEQVRKWTTKAQLTGQTSHRPFEHFQHLTSGNLWSLRQDRESAIRFTIEPLRSPTTAELGVAFAMPLNTLRNSSEIRNVASSASALPDARFLVLNVRPRAVVDTVMPPGFGFAVIAPDGKVLFHSDDGLSLEENFFAEVSNAQSVRERMQVERAVAWSGDYHGTPHRILMQPVSTLQDSPWKIVAFQDLSPGLASVVDHQTGTFRLSLFYLALLLTGALLFWWHRKSRGRDIRDLITAPQSPDPVRLRGLAVLMLLAGTALALTGLPSAHEWADLLFLFFVLLPFAALGVSWYARQRDRSDNSSALLIHLELAMLVLLVGAAPAAGFARIVHRVQNVQAAERWLELAHQRLVAHASRVRARATSPGYTETTRAKLIALTSLRDVESNALDFYMSGSPVMAPYSDATCRTERPQSGQVLVRGLLDWTMFSSDHLGRAEISACAGSGQLKMTGNGISLAAKVWPDRAAANLDRGWLAAHEWERWALAIVLIAPTIAAAYWARRRLMTPRSVRAAIFEDVLTVISSEGNEGIMLVGPPRTGKDRFVRDTVMARAGFSKTPGHSEPIYRIKLLDATIDAAFLKLHTEKVAERSKQHALLDAQERLWIHVSNLETQLITAERRTAVLELLEKLLERPDGTPCRVVVVTTSIDPIAQFHEIFTTEREGIHGDDIPEVELSRSSLLLSRFRRCYRPIKANSAIDPWRKYDPSAWPTTLDWEAANYPPLVEVAKGIRNTLRDRTKPGEGVSRFELARAFQSEALAAYDLLWESCTRCEKIVLVQLAQEGFITTRDCEVVWGLIHKGLIVERPKPTIFNNSFRVFLRHIEHDHVVEQWERQDGNGLWLVAGRLIGSSLIAGGLFYLTTQDFSVDSLLPVVSGTGMFGAPLVRALLARVTMRGAADVSV